MLFICQDERPRDMIKAGGHGTIADRTAPVGGVFLQTFSSVYVAVQGQKTMSVAASFNHL